MVVSDRVYGQIQITHPLIKELINSSPVQRLKKVGQSGADNLIDLTRNISRFEHSIGVWYLLQKYGANTEEQVAGLLHDTPHTAFSHVADMVFPNEDYTYHERFTEKVILDSEIPGILKKYGLSAKRILNKSKFHLLDAELPDLSADRIDYFLRDT